MRKTHEAWNTLQSHFRRQASDRLSTRTAIKQLRAELRVHLCTNNRCFHKLQRGQTNVEFLSTTVVAIGIGVSAAVRCVPVIQAALSQTASTPTVVRMTDADFGLSARHLEG